MSEALLVPVRVHARVVRPSGAIPAVSVDASLGQLSGGPSAPGVYLRWNLPEALTRGEPIDGGGTRFPAVPDRWLVARFGAAANAYGERTPKLWIVDARSGAATVYTGGPIAAAPADGLVMTVMGAWPGGVWPRGRPDTSTADNLFEGLGYPSWQVGKAPTPAYRPFGLYDDLADQPATGDYTLTYAVVGWYSRAADDPLASQPYVTNRLAAMTRLGWSLQGFTDLKEHAVVIAEFLHLGASGGDLSYQWADKAPDNAGSSAVLWDAPDYTLIHGAVAKVPWGSRAWTEAPRALSPGWLIDESLAAALAQWQGGSYATQRFLESLLAGQADPDDWQKQEWDYARHGAAFEPIGETEPIATSTGTPAWAALPRWYRPGLPRLLVHGAGRSLDLDPADAGGKLACRRGRELLTAWSLSGADTSDIDVNGYPRQGSGELKGADLWAPPAGWAIPAAVVAVVQEVTLYDPANTSPVAVWFATGSARDLSLDKSFEAAATYALREGLLGSAEVELRHGSSAVPLYFEFRPVPSKASAPPLAALGSWTPPWVPVAVRVEMGFVPADLPVNSPVAALAPEFGAAEWSAPAPGAGASSPVTLHTPLTPVVPNTLASNAELRGLGDAADVAALRTADLLSCAVDGVDAIVRAQGRAVRAGRLTPTKVEVQDIFGVTLRLTTDAATKVHDLRPRLPYAARLSLRFRTPDNAADASATASPVLGYLLADPVDRAVELLTPAGEIWGEVVDEDPPRWIERKPLALDPVMRALRQGLCAPAPTGSNGLRATWNVSDLLDLTDTTRLFVDPVTGKETSWRNRLAGRPIAVVRARVVLERRDADKGGRPASLAPLSGLPVELGNLTLGRDGLLGWFLDSERSGTTPWTTLCAIDPSLRRAFLNDAEMGDPTLQVRSWHPAAVYQRRLHLSEEQPQDVILLLDGTADVGLISRVLPFKRVSVLPEWFEAATGKVPSIRVGPVLEAPTRVATPAPPFEGRTWGFEQRDGESWRARDVRTEGLNELPEGRVKVLSGWLRLGDPPT